MDVRNTQLGKMIESIFPKKANDVNIDNKTVVIGKGKYVSKCSFKETDEIYYINLIRFTFVEKQVRFVDGKDKEYKDFSRNIAVDNAIKYLNVNGICINCKFYSEADRYLLSKFICTILEEYLRLMFSYREKFNENESEYKRKYGGITKKYQRDIVVKGINNLIYAGAVWSDVECYKEDGSDVCLLIDNGNKWRNSYYIQYIDTTIEISLKSDLVQNDDINSNIEQNDNKYQSIELYSGKDLENKAISGRTSQICSIDFFNKNNDYYVPNKICYFAKSDKELITEEKTPSILNMFKEYDPPCISELKNRAFEYINKTYCSDRKKHYMNKLSNIVEIISFLLRINYNDFYSDKYNIAESMLSHGLEQLKYFIEDNEIEYTKKEVNNIYKYLITLWLRFLVRELKNFDFEEMYSLYDDGEYKSSIDECIKRINKFKSLDILEEAYDSYRHFSDNNKKLINSFESKVNIVKEISAEEWLANINEAEYDIFKELKTSIGVFKKRLNWDVPYYVELTIVKGNEKRTYKKYIGYGHVGDTVPIEHKEDEHFIVEGPDTITLKDNENIAKLKYILKEEFVNKTIKDNVQEVDDYKSQILKFKKNHRYKIEFEVHAGIEAMLNCFIIRQTNSSCEIVFAQNEIKVGPDLKNHSFEFIYNGETEDSNYLTFGYDNVIYEFKIHGVKISEVE